MGDRADTPQTLFFASAVTRVPRPPYSGALDTFVRATDLAAVALEERELDKEVRLGLGEERERAFLGPDRRGACRPAPPAAAA